MNDDTNRVSVCAENAIGSPTITTAADLTILRGAFRTWITIFTDHETLLLGYVSMEMLSRSLSRSTYTSSSS